MNSIAARTLSRLSGWWQSCRLAWAAWRNWRVWAAPRAWPRLLRLRGPAGPGAARGGDERQQARVLIRAIDAGGLPLNPARVNSIARGLGLEVSSHAPVDQTVQRIREALERMGT